MNDSLIFPLTIMRKNNSLLNVLTIEIQVYYVLLKWRGESLPMEHNFLD